MSNPLLAACAAVFLAGAWLRWLNLRHLRRRGGRVPPGFEGRVDAPALARAAAYAADRTRFGLVEGATLTGLALAFAFGGGLGAYDRWVAGWAGTGPAGGAAFFLGLHWARSLAGLPFSAWETFRVEARHGFNRTSARLWAADRLKAEALATGLVAGLAAGALALVQWSPARWWLWVWALLAGVTVLLVYLSPVVLEPLFLRFEPVRAEGFEDEVRALAERAGIRVGRVLQVDASRRSAHSNAYFTGVGRVKRIVLFDTLLAHLTRAEALAVVAHEAGHWRLGHVTRPLAGTLCLGLGALYLAFRFLPWPGLPGLVGLESASVPARAVILAIVGSVAAFPLTPLGAWLSRRRERAADRFACRVTGDPGALASALVALGRENLANLYPHPAFAAFYLTHPPLAERVAGLRRRAPSRVGDDGPIG
ncbi:MAG: M48 family metallopeptidase [Deferrisomatales bacterium]